MSLIRLERVTKTFDPQIVLDDISWQVARGDRVGLVGANGTGKTTCLEIMAGLQEPTQGAVYRAKGLRLGYLSQDSSLPEDRPLRDAMLDVFAEQRRLEESMHDVSERMGAADTDAELEELLARYDRLQHTHELQGGYAYEHRIDSILGGLGFDPDEFGKQIGVMSGGEKARASLARLLLEDPELLLLDEPTNHLDVNAVEWFESFLGTEYKGGYVVVSHDRYFLDKVTKKTVELRDRRITEYRGNYSQYANTRERDALAQQRQYELQQEYIARTEEYIRRNIAGQNTKQAQGRRKILKRLERVERPDADKPRIRVDLKAQTRGGDDVLIADDAAIDYGSGPVFSGVSFHVRRTDVLGIMGPNGAGKTSLFRLILGEEEPVGGIVRVGGGVEVGYLGQEHDGLREDRSVLQEVWAAMPASSTEGDVRSLLARFLFFGDDVLKRISTLSGGERSRVSLCRLLLTRANLLLLDEPTNHLDIPSREALEQALEVYPGTLVIVSHDRYLLSRLATKLLVFGDGTAQFWQRSYAEWERWRAEQQDRAREQRAEPKKPPAAAQSQPKPKGKKSKGTPRPAKRPVEGKADKRR